VEFLRHLRNNPLAFIGLLMVIGVLAVAAAAPLLATPNEPDPYQRPRTWMQPEPPGTPGHPLGTGVLGADIYYGIIWGTRIALFTAVSVVSVTLVIGILLGGVAGYYGGVADEVIMRLTDLFMSIPGLILAMAVVSALGRSLEFILIALVIVWWPWYVRIFRSQVIVTKESQYVEAARVSGASEPRIMFRHVVPNSLSPLIVQASLDMGIVLLIAAGLSFLGFGAQPGFAEWGLMIAEGRNFIAQGFWWMVFIPGIAITIFVLGFNFLGDGLRDVLDPKLRSVYQESAAERKDALTPPKPRAGASLTALFGGTTRLLGIEDLSLRFKTERGEAKVLEGVNLEIFPGETFGLVGETGCGKSVTAKTIVGLIDRPPAKITRGKVWYTKQDAQGTRRRTNLLLLDEARLAKIRGSTISMIFQDPMTSLNPVVKVGAQIAESFHIHRRRDMLRAVSTRLNNTLELLPGGEELPQLVHSEEARCSRCSSPAPESLAFCRNCDVYYAPRRRRPFPLRKLRRAHRLARRMLQKDTKLLRFLARLPSNGLKRLLKQEALYRAYDLIREVRIPDPEKASESYPFELSGGMQQRVAIAMALACRPSLLIADEPTTALDVTIQAQVLKLISELKEQHGMSVLLITHNLGVVAEQCARVGVMYAGSVAEVGEVQDIFQAPLHPYTQGLMKAIPILGEHRENLAVIPGRVPDFTDPPSGCRFRTRCPYVFDRCAAEVPRLKRIEDGHWVSCHLYDEPGRVHELQGRGG
jgi:oligopeptide/dipeptide ABC transporter ATP-binding protein